MTETVSKKQQKPSGKTLLIEQARQTMEERLEGGDDSPLELLIEARRQESWVKGELEALKAPALREAHRWPEKSFTLTVGDHRAMVTKTVRSAGGKTDYSGDPYWRLLKAMLEEHEGKLDALDGPTLIVNGDGEEYTALPPVRSGSLVESVSIQFLTDDHPGA